MGLESVNRYGNTTREQCGHLICRDWPYEIARYRRSAVLVPGLIESLQDPLRRLRSPDFEQVCLRPFAIQLSRPHQHQRARLVVVGEIESFRLCFAPDLAFLESGLEDRRVFMRAPPDPEFAMSLEAGLPPACSFRDARQVKA